MRMKPIALQFQSLKVIDDNFRLLYIFRNYSINGCGLMEGIGSVLVKVKTFNNTFCLFSFGMVLKFLKLSV